MTRGLDDVLSVAWWIVESLRWLKISRAPTPAPATRKEKHMPFALVPTLLALIPTIEKYAGLIGDLQKLHGVASTTIADVEKLFSKHQVTADAATGCIVFHGGAPQAEGNGNVVGA